MNDLDNNEDILKEIRMKYAEDLEQILECPVCFELPKGEIVMCTNGHHVCLKCKNQLLNLNKNCPTCDRSFSTCRNYVAENLCSKFEDIKNSILDPRHASNRRVIKNRSSVYIQTEPIDISTVKAKNSTSSIETQTEDKASNDVCKQSS